MTPTGTDDAWLAATAAALARFCGGEPRLVIDLARLETNADRLAAALAPGRALRLVQKSLPSLPLLRLLAARLHTQRLMVFHRPYLNLYAAQWPEADLLLGKPMPVAAAAAFYAGCDPRSGFDPQRQLHWLIDSAERLEQYLTLARTLDTSFSIALEIDVGLHRGGFAAPQAMAAALDRIAAEPHRFRLTGLMGYDAQVAKAPPWVGVPRALRDANARYAAFDAALRERHPALAAGLRFRNGAGSPTATLHDAASPVDELAVGSALVKPSDFDLPSLDGLQCAALIATPVLKVLDRARVPFLEALATRRRLAVFVYGGRWMARPVWPPGMRENALYGLSSNQQLMTLPAHVPVAVDDVALFRPTQSEAVLAMFGPILGMRDGRPECVFEVDDALIGREPMPARRSPSPPSP